MASSFYSIATPRLWVLSPPRRSEPFSPHHHEPNGPPIRDLCRWEWLGARHTLDTEEVHRRGGADAGDQLTTETLGVLLHAAGAVPVVDTPPPWRIEVNGHLIDVYLDDAPLLPAADPTARALRICYPGTQSNDRTSRRDWRDSFDQWF
jgi:hypothetical protein